MKEKVGILTSLIFVNKMNRLGGSSMKISEKQQKCIQLIEKVLDIKFQGGDARLWIKEYLPKSKAHVEHMKQVVSSSGFPIRVQEYVPHTSSMLDVLERNSIRNGCPSTDDIERSIDFNISVLSRLS